MKKIVSLFLICLFINGCGYNYELVDYYDVIKMMDNEEIVIIDVRNIDEYNSGHIDGAINISVNDIENIDYDKETEIILYCATGVRSLEAAKILSDLGYVNIYNLDGGILNWGEELVK